mmetsp:Transcript_28920/g.46571  ORF Transcript_28920/g.46571 Transcript_28920/m.46571 type:complete len:93 (+) Transcript_28920:323-601(+)
MVEPPPFSKIEALSRPDNAATPPEAPIVPPGSGRGERACPSKAVMAERADSVIGVPVVGVEENTSLPGEPAMGNPVEVGLGLGRGLFPATSP